MKTGSIDSIESMGLVDGPGIRTVIFLNGCSLRCLYCHNPEMWKMKDKNITPEELVEKVKRYKPYYQDNGGVTFSGGEPLMQPEFLLECCRLLKKENIHIALDTAGVGTRLMDEILDLVDLVILDVKHIDKVGYQSLVKHDISDFLDFIEKLKNHNNRVWLRQVVVPGIHDNMDYVKRFAKFIKKIPHVEKVEFIPYHKLGTEKYDALKLYNPLKDLPAMDKEKCEKLYQEFLKLK